jgi:hypothetical protein
MAAFLSGLTAGVATLALAGGLWRIAARLQALEDRHGPKPASSEPSSSRVSGAKPLLSALYREPPPSLLSGLGSLPGARWVGAALLLALIALVLPLRTPEGPRPVATLPDSGVAHLHQRLDSLALIVTQLRDSLRLAAAPRPSGAQPAPTRLARQPTARVATVLPAAPPPPPGSAVP